MAVDLRNESVNVPFVDGKHILIGGELLEWEGNFTEVVSPLIHEADEKHIPVGRQPQLDKEFALKALEAARKAWEHGRGEWPQMKIHDRIGVVKTLVRRLQEIREEVVNILMWEICKSRKDAISEFDRTLEFIEATAAEFESIVRKEFVIHEHGEVYGKVLRCPIGVMLALGPSNYPFNETYTSIIPALLAGNVVILKIPASGGLVHLLTQHIYLEIFPKGVINFVSGSGREVATAIMEQGVDIFSFVGSSQAADALIKVHPSPHRLKLNLSLEGKNIAIVTESSVLDQTIDQIVAGALTYNGQRCTALKLIFVHSSIAPLFLNCLSTKVKTLPIGLPWDRDVQITPMDSDQLKFVKELVEDAERKGALSMHGGGTILAGGLMEPIVLFPIDASMRLWKEEQFGPIVAIAPYDDITQIFDYVAESNSGLQCSRFLGKISNVWKPFVKLWSILLRE